MAGLGLATMVGPVAANPAGGRAWELITPAEPLNALIDEPLVVRDDGGRVIYLSMGSLPGAPSGDLFGGNLGVRAEDGWRSESIGGPYLVPKFDFTTFFGPTVVAFDPQLSSVVLTYAAPLLPDGPEHGRVGVYRWTEGGGLELLADLGGEGKVIGASDDLTRVIGSTAEHLLPSDAGRTQGTSIYEAEGGALRQVDVDSGGSLLSACGSSATAAGVSESAARVYFLNPSSSGSCGPPRLFLREGGSTTQVSVSHCTESCGSAGAATFAGATPSGSVAFFATTQRMTDEDQNAKRDLYRFDADTEEVALVSPGTAGMEGEVATAPAHVSSDGSVVYFYSQGRLLPGEGGTGKNLWVAGAETRFVARVGNGDPLGVSDDGGVAALSTALSLDPADTDTSVDTYVYRRQADELSIVSRGPLGGDGAFDASIESTTEAAAEVVELMPHPVAADGAHVFFSTAERLIAADQNEVDDVYEWTPGGLGLVSPGTGDDPATFAAASADGHTVVIRTSATLLPRDRDGGDIDLYAARPGGGFDERAAAAPSCDGCGALPLPRFDRPVAASEARGARRPDRVRFRLAGRGACGAITRRGVLPLVAAVSRPGRVSAVAVGRIGKRRRRLLHGVAGAVRPGRLRVRLAAPPAMRRALRRRLRMRLRVRLRLGSANATRNVTIRCGGSKR